MKIKDKDMTEEEKLWFDNSRNENYPGYVKWNRKLFEIWDRLVTEKAREMIDTTLPELPQEQRDQLHKRFLEVIEYAVHSYVED